MQAPNVKPDLKFMVCGFSKCGTTSLYDMLGEHPIVFGPAIKETNFFTFANYADRWPEFASHFAGLKPNQIACEGTTMYSAYEHEKLSRDRILEYYPNIKFIFIARHPHKRIESSYREFHHSGINFALNCPYDLAEAMTELPALVEDTKYWTRINNYREAVGDDRILVLFFEDLVTDHQTVLARCFRFIGIDPAPAKTIDVVHKNSKETKLYDSRPLRRMRLNPFWGFKIARLTPDEQNRYLRWIGLRRKFTKPPKWNEAALDIVARCITNDALQFLRYYNKPENFWGKLPQPK